jgi:general secretion pathway protein A
VFVIFNALKGDAMAATSTILGATMQKYGLLEAPFSISPDPRFLYLSAQHHLALSKIRYVIENRQGFAVLYGDIGHGKSTLVRRIYDIYKEDESFETILITNPDLPSEMQLLKRITDSFGLDRRRSKLDQMEELESYLVAQYSKGKNVLMLIDEAQMMVGGMFELVRQITNFESHSAKLVQIVLSGQNNLRNKLKLKRPLLSRAAAIATLDPFTLDETREMIDFRVTVAGRKKLLFEPEAVDEIFSLTKGVPREIVKVCMDSLTIASINNLKSIPKEAVHSARAE